MNTQPNQNEVKKKGVLTNPSRDVKYEDQKFGEQIDEGAGEEINPSELDNSEVELDRGGVEFGGGQEEGKPSEPGQPDQPDQKMSSDLGGDISKISGQAKTDKDLRH